MTDMFERKTLTPKTVKATAKYILVVSFTDQPNDPTGPYNLVSKVFDLKSTDLLDAMSEAEERIPLEFRTWDYVRAIHLMERDKAYGKYNVSYSPRLATRTAGLWYKDDEDHSNGHDGWDNGPWFLIRTICKAPYDREYRVALDNTENRTNLVA